VFLYDFWQLCGANAKAGKSTKAQAAKTGGAGKLLKIKGETLIFLVKKVGGRFWIRTRDSIKGLKIAVS
jgi:hypothetical protein